MTATPPGTAGDVDRSDADWLYALLGADHRLDHGTGTMSYLARPNVHGVQLLLPTRPRRSAAASLRRLTADRGLRARIEMGMGRAAGRLGLLGQAPGEPITLPRFELVDHLARVLGEPELVAAVTLGPRRRNRKPVLQLLRPDGRIAGFAKVGWSTLTRDLVTNEAEILRTIDGLLPPTIVTPAVVTVERWRDLVIVVTGELRPSRVATGRRRSVVDAMASISSLGQAAARPIANSATVSEAQRLDVGRLVDLDRLLDRHDGVTLATGLWHGDFTPWNLDRRGRSLLVWDWELAGWGRPRGFDALHRHFERLRRSPGGSNRVALAAVLDDAPLVLADARIDLDEHRHDAIIDLYLCELIGRELRLEGQRWSGGDLATLAGEAALVLDRRLG